MKITADVRNTSQLYQLTIEFFLEERQITNPQPLKVLTFVCKTWYYSCLSNKLKLEYIKLN